MEWINWFELQLLCNNYVHDCEPATNLRTFVTNYILLKTSQKNWHNYKLEYLTSNYIRQYLDGWKMVFRQKGLHPGQVHSSRGWVVVLPNHKLSATIQATDEKFVQIVPSCIPKLLIVVKKRPNAYFRTNKMRKNLLNLPLYYE